MVKKQKRVAIYARVSTDGQTVENQLRELGAVVERHDWQIVGVFEDQGVSGAKGRADRPAMKRLLAAVKRRECDMVAAWKLDRLGRSLKDLIGFLDELKEKRVDLYIHNFKGDDALDTSTSAGKLMFHITAAFAEFERDTIVDRVRAGMARAKAEQLAGKERVGRNGKKKLAIGRPRTIGPEIVAAVRAAKAEGLSIEKIAKAQKIGVGTVHRIVKATAK
jgi:DNA invertase Pin-like site-specific DNA recombinase